MRWVGFRERHLTTRAGDVTLVRGYWHCAACGTGEAPDDAAWDLPPGNASWGVREGSSLLGALLPSFEQGANLLQALTLFQVSARSAETWTEAIGAAYAPPPLAPTDPGPVADLLVIEADACMTLWRTDHQWHEQKVYAAWRRVAGVDQPVRYATAQGPWATQDDLVLQLARRTGLRQAREVLCLADGAHAIWRLFSRLFPQAFQLLDWYHLMEHLGEVAKVHPDGAAWLAQQQEALRFRGPRETLLSLKALHQRDAVAEVRAAAGACLKYMWWHRWRMDYPEARRRGYPIGSGRIESAVKQVVQARAKQAGMSWVPAHLQWVLQARCAALSGEWEVACAQAKAAARAVSKPLTPPSRGRAQPVSPVHRAPPQEAPTPAPQETLSHRQMGQIVKQAMNLGK